MVASTNQHGAKARESKVSSQGERKMKIVKYSTLRKSLATLMIDQIRDLAPSR